jgi:predicted GH43/DUF377 family glycosyl hydrolase
VTASDRVGFAGGFCELPVRVVPDPARVLLLPQIWNSVAAVDGLARRLAALPDEQVDATLAELTAVFADRHRDLDRTWRDRGRTAAAGGGRRREMLLGALLSYEHTVEGAGVCNPSVVSHGQRLVLSIRAIGEQHLSCIEFRTGVVGGSAGITLDSRTGRCGSGVVVPSGSGTDYDVRFDPDTALDERVLWPVTADERSGMEDLRLARLVEDGKDVYHGTYSAFDGIRIRPKSVRTEDFVHFRIRALTGAAAAGKGFSVFTRRADGTYLGICRPAKDEVALATSRDAVDWQVATTLPVPREPWAMGHVSNCGPPVATPYGWLLFLHGVGPMRRYGITAVLLDLEDPARVIGRSRKPLLTSGAGNRTGYTPNALYSCGALVHDGQVFLPFAPADSEVRIAVAALDDVAAACGVGAVLPR